MTQLWPESDVHPSITANLAFYLILFNEVKLNVSKRKNQRRGLGLLSTGNTVLDVSLLREYPATYL